MNNSPLFNICGNQATEANTEHRIGEAYMFMGACSPCTFNDNLSNNFTTGIYLGGNLVPLGDQGNANLASTNRWGGEMTSGGNHTKIENGVVNPIQNKIFNPDQNFVAVPAGTYGWYYLPNDYWPEPGFAWLLQPSADTYNFCVEGNAPHEFMQRINILDDIALDSAKTIGTSLNIRFNMKENLAKATLIEPELLDFLPIQQFADSIDPANLGKIMEASTMINSHMTSSDSTLFREKLEEINVGVLPENLIKETYLLLSKNLGLKDSIYTSTEIQRLRQIAGYCPYTKGNAVITARSILASLNPTDIFYRNACEQTATVNGNRVAPLDPEDEIDLNRNKKVELRNKHLLFSILPNPSTGSVKIIVEGINDSKKQLQILSSEGKSLNEIVFVGNKQDLDLSKFDNGLYLIKITDIASGTTYLNKLILNK